MMFGQWNTNVVVGKMPQKVASAFGELNNLVGAEYTPIAYLGSQEVNGTNHAVLAEQTIVTGKDTKNVVLVVFNEKADGVTLANIERVVEGGEAFGGVKIDARTEIPEDASHALEYVLSDFVGAAVKPFVLLATQATKGVDYIFAATVMPVAPEAKAKAAIVTVNPLTKQASFADLLANKNGGALGYAFSWMA